MKVHVLSDLHIEFARFELPRTDAEVIVLAGDTNVKGQGLKWALAQDTDKPIVYILGNHEFYGSAYPRQIEKLKEAAEGTNVHVLENDVFVHDGVRFLGCTLWTDFELHGNARVAGFHASQCMTDFRKIRRSPWYSRLRSMDAASIHAGSARWIRQTLTGGVDDRLSVVVTHHAPSPRSLPKEERHDILSAAYASDLEGLVEECGAALWIHGHIHQAVDYQVGDTRIVANPRGYPDEHSGFSPTLVIDVGGPTERGQNI